MNSLKKQEINENYTKVPNDVLMSTKLSMRAKGIWAYLWSKPDGWAFSADRIASETAEGRGAILAGLSELEEQGYLSRKKLQSGKMQYNVFFDSRKVRKPQSAKTAKCENRKVRKPQSAKTAKCENRTLYKDSNNNKTDNNNKTYSPKGEANAEKPTQDQKSFGNEGVNFMLGHLKEKVGIEDFREEVGWQRRYGMNLVNLMNKLGDEEFFYRVEEILEDDFKRQNCNSLRFIYREVKGFMPRVQAKARAEPMSLDDEISEMDKLRAMQERMQKNLAPK
jgi:hypothetical protein